MLKKQPFIEANLPMIITKQVIRDVLLFMKFLKLIKKMRQYIFDEKNANDIYNLAKEQGMTPLREAALGKVKSGETTIEEILRATVEDN